MNTYSFLPQLMPLWRPNNQILLPTLQEQALLNWMQALPFLTSDQFQFPTYFFAISSSILIVFCSPSLIESLIAFGEKSAFS
jgi:hypothetical protein